MSKNNKQLNAGQVGGGKQATDPLCEVLHLNIIMDWMKLLTCGVEASICTTILIFCSLSVCQYISSHQWWIWNTVIKHTQRQNLLFTAPIKMNRQHGEWNSEWKFCSIDENYINKYSLIQKFTYTLQNLQNVNYFNKIIGIIIQNACYLFITTALREEIITFALNLQFHSTLKTMYTM